MLESKFQKEVIDDVKKRLYPGIRAVKERVSFVVASDGDVLKHGPSPLS